VNLPGPKPGSIKRSVGRSHSAPPRRLALLLATALLFGLAGSAMAEGGQSSYAARPAPGPGDRSSGTFHMVVGAGASASDAVEIFNYTGEPAAFMIYGADAVRTTSGSLAPAAREAPITGPGSWIKVGQARVTVPPRSSATVPFSVEVPQGATLGLARAALLIEPQIDRSGGTVGTITRVGLWVDVDVTEGEGGTTAGSIDPWIAIAVALLLAFLVWLAYVTRHRRRRWLEERREEQEAIRDLRARRRHGGPTPQHR
jgi:hypothetical protein